MGKEVVPIKNFDNVKSKAMDANFLNKLGSSIASTDIIPVEDYDLDAEIVDEVDTDTVTNKEYIVSSYGSNEGFSTLWAISKDSGVSIDEIKAANPEIGDDNVIHPGQKIIVPIKNQIETESVDEVSKDDYMTETVEEPVEEIVKEVKSEKDDTNFAKTQDKSNEVAVSSIEVPANIAQTGIIPNYTNYDYFYEKWNTGTKQYEVSRKWAEQGKNSDRGIATIDDRYLVAVSPVFGKAGDKIGVVLEDGTTIDCIIADVKGGDADSRYGHKFGSQVDVIEWESLGKQDTIKLGDWKGKNVVEIVNYGSYIDEG